MECPGCAETVFAGLTVPAYGGVKGRVALLPQICARRAMADPSSCQCPGAVCGDWSAGLSVCTLNDCHPGLQCAFGLPCGACYPYTTKPCVASCNDVRPCSVCPGGGCSACPAPVRPCPTPCPLPPILPCLPPCPPCDKPRTCVPCKEPLCDSVAIPCCRPNRCKPCPCYCCTEPAVCSPKRCSFPGVPVCGGCCGPCMPVW